MVDEEILIGRARLRAQDRYIDSRHHPPRHFRDKPCAPDGLWHARNQDLSWFYLPAIQPVERLGGYISKIICFDKLVHPYIRNLKQAIILAALIFAFYPVPVFETPTSID